MAVIFVLSLSCNPTRDRWINRNWHTLTGHYNVYFNGEKKFNDAMETLEKGHQDDFTKLIEVFPYGDEAAQKGISGTMDDVTKKASLTIQLHNIGNFTDNAYLLLGKAQYFKRDYFAALEPFQYINAKYKDKGLRPVATSWVAKCYMGLNKEGEAEAIMGLLMNEVDPIQLKGKLANAPTTQVKITNEDKSEIYATAAFIALKQKNYSKAIEKLTVANDFESRKPRRIRYTYLLAQLYQLQGKTKESNKYFKKILGMIAPYNFEFNASINIARSYDSTDKSAVRKVRRSLKRMLNDDKNDGLYDQIYYELGNLEKKERNLPMAVKYYKLSASKSVKNLNQKGLSFLSLATIYLEQPEYKLAQAYYDSAAGSFKKDYIDYDAIMAKKTVLSELISNLIVIETEDSLQKLSKLSKDQLEKKIDEWILAQKTASDIKAKADKKQKEIDKSNELNQSAPAPSPAAGFGGDAANWYFYNPAIIASGSQEFFSNKKWGQRANTDYWRIAAKEKEIPPPDPNAVSPTKSKSDSSSNDKSDSSSDTQEKRTDVKNTISSNRKAWIANVPFTDEELQKSNEKILEAYYNIGLVYDEKLNDQREAANSFNDLLKRFEGNKYEPEVLYRLYKIYSKHKLTLSKAEECKSKLIAKYPQSPYALILQGKGTKTADSDPNKEVNRFYEKMYDVYENANYVEVKKMYLEARKKFPGNTIQAKFELLNAIAIGKSETLDNFKSALAGVIKEYPKTDVADKAQSILDAIKRQAMAALPDSVRKELEPDFVIEPSGGQYYVFAMKNDKVDFTDLVAKFTQFNEEYHQFENLKSNTMISNEGYQLILVREFTDYNMGLAYLNDLEVIDYIKKQMKVETSYTHFIISVNNFKKLLKEQKLESYDKIFKKHYTHPNSSNKQQQKP